MCVYGGGGGGGIHLLQALAGPLVTVIYSKGLSPTPLDLKSHLASYLKEGFSRSVEVNIRASCFTEPC